MTTVRVRKVLKKLGIMNSRVSFSRDQPPPPAENQLNKPKQRRSLAKKKKYPVAIKPNSEKNPVELLVLIKIALEDSPRNFSTNDIYNIMLSFTGYEIKMRASVKEARVTLHEIWLAIVSDNTQPMDDNKEEKNSPLQL